MRPRRTSAAHPSSNSSNSSNWVILNAIRLIVQDLREASRAAEQKFGLGAAQLFVLQTLAQAPGLSVNDVAARTYTHQSSVSAVLKKLVRRKLVAARPAADDARRLELFLTPKGYALSRRAPDAIQVHLIRGLDSLSRSERDAAARGLGRLVSAMGGAGREPTMFLEDQRQYRGGKRRARGSKS
jgi:DNA-binding MarR family transcriptional regulator